jgi:hypothetical protein
MLEHGRKASRARPRDLHLDALPELERRGLEQGDLDEEDAGIDRAAGVLGAELPADDDVGDLLDPAAPGPSREALGGDGGLGPRGDAGEASA